MGGSGLRGSADPERFATSLGRKALERIPKNPNPARLGMLKARSSYREALGGSDPLGEVGRLSCSLPTVLSNPTNPQALAEPPRAAGDADLKTEKPLQDSLRQTAKP